MAKAKNKRKAAPMGRPKKVIRFEHANLAKMLKTKEKSIWVREVACDCKLAQDMTRAAKQKVEFTAEYAEQEAEFTVEFAKQQTEFTAAFAKQKAEFTAASA